MQIDNVQSRKLPVKYGVLKDSILVPFFVYYIIFLYNDLYV